MPCCLHRLACVAAALAAAILPAAAQTYSRRARRHHRALCGRRRRRHRRAPDGGRAGEGIRHPTVQVANKPGAASQVGLTELGLRQKPDGYTLVDRPALPTVTTHYLDPKRQAPYTRASFQPVATHYISTMTLSVRGDSPYRTLRDFVEAGRAAPGRLTVSDSGLLATPHTTTLMLQGVTGAKFTAVHFTGGQPSVTALLGGHVDALAGGVSDALPHWRSGAFRVLGIAAEVPDPAMPDVPTMRAQGFDVVSASIGMLVAPAGTPREIVDTLAQAARRVVADADHAAKLTDFGSTVHFHGPDETAAIWQATEQRITPLLEQLER